MAQRDGGGMVVVGHLGGGEYSPEMLGAPDVGIFNVMRDCVGREVSLLFYHLFGGGLSYAATYTEPGSTEQKASHTTAVPDDEIVSQQAYKLGLDRNATKSEVDACMHDPACVVKSPLMIDQKVNI